MKSALKYTIVAVGVIVILGGVVVWHLHGNRVTEAAPLPAKPASAVRGIKPALTVAVTNPVTAEWAVRLNAVGNVEAWQEAVISPEISGLRLVELLVNVGDVVKRDQVLARFSDVMVKADAAQAHAVLAESEAALAEATANADRARTVQEPGVLSAQQVSEYLTAEKISKARLEVARAQVANQQTRLDQTRLVAPDDGVVSARSATVGAVLGAGQELCRLIRFNRLEWRAEVPAADLPLVQVDQAVTFMAPDGLQLSGKVRMVAPTVDRATRMALVYVDIPAGHGLKPGIFLRGDFELGRSAVMALPQSAVIQREGFHYVFRLEHDNKLTQLKVSAGRRLGSQVEITGGLEAGARVVAAGLAFLADGDTVRVVDSVLNQAGKVP